jgi:hypothetical protein
MLTPQENLYKTKYELLVRDYNKLLIEFNLIDGMSRFMSVDEYLSDEQFDEYEKLRKEYFKFKGFKTIDLT